jgi:EAL domain-containing protein (putative c-di-GMP-specific phosphodiesterase class I)
MNPSVERNICTSMVPGSAPGEPDVRDSWLAMRTLAEREDLSVVFQPIVDLSTGVIFAHEALLRCQLPQYSSPQILFERAAETGCAGRLGRVMRDLAVPLAAGKPLFLNVHPHELNEGWLLRPDDPIFTHDAPIYLEITEAVPLTHFELVQSVLEELRARGDVLLVVDDLGAGYSNLKSIADLEPRVVKLDRGLIVGIDTHPRQRHLVTNVCSLCHDLGALVVAEGIETRSEFDAIRETGADLAQGFLLARPSYPFPSVTFPPDASVVRQTR